MIGRSIPIFRRYHLNKHVAGKTGDAKMRRILGCIDRSMFVEFLVGCEMSHRAMIF